MQGGGIGSIVCRRIYHGVSIRSGRRGRLIRCGELGGVGYIEGVTLVLGGLFCINLLYVPYVWWSGQAH